MSEISGWTRDDLIEDLDCTILYVLALTSSRNKQVRFDLDAKIQDNAHPKFGKGENIWPDVLDRKDRLESFDWEILARNEYERDLD